MNISKLITLPLLVLFCASCDSSGNAASGAAIADISTAPVAAPPPAPEPVVEQFRTVIDDFGNSCRMENSTMCGGWGVALVPAHNDVITGLACGPGTAVGQWVQNFEWVPC